MNHLRWDVGWDWMGLGGIDGIGWDWMGLDGIGWDWVWISPGKMRYRAPYCVNINI